jgi:hypothetical protein
MRLPHSHYTLFTALLLLAAPPVLLAQAGRKHLAVGVYGGWDRTSLHGPDIPGPLHTNGALGGAFLQWRLVSHLDFQPEIQFVQKGNREVDNQGGGVFALRIRLNYVEIPLLVRVSGPVLGGRITPFLLGGPEVAFKAGCRLKTFGLTGTFTCADLPKAKSYDYGVIGGAGVDVGVGRAHFALSARYDHGLLDVFEGNDPQNRAISVVLGVSLW